MHSIPTDGSPRRTQFRRLSSSRGLDRYEKHVSKTLSQSKARQSFAHSVDSLLQDLRGRLEKNKARQEQLLYRFVTSKAFSAFCMFMILANAVWMGYESDHRRAVGTGWLKIVGLSFTTWFGFEMLLKLVAFRHEFFVGPDYLWNLLDLFLVLSSIPEYLANSVRFSIIRILRLCRLTRTFRVMRVLKYLTSLREMLLSLVHTLASLFWAFVAMVLVTYIWALLFMQFLDLEWNDTLQHRTGSHFMSVRFTMITLYSWFSGGMDWHPFMTDFEENGAYLTECLLLVFVFFMNFGLVNVVIGVFCAKANEASNENKELRLHKEEQQYIKNVNDLVLVFNMIDVHRAGVIEREQFLAFANGAETQAILHSHGVPSFAVDKIWRIMDECDGRADGRVNLTSFLMAFMRLSRHSVSTELMIVSLQVLEMRSDVNHIIQQVRGFEQILRAGQSCKQDGQGDNRHMTL